MTAKRNYGLMAGAAAIALGGLLLVGAGCVSNEANAKEGTTKGIGAIFRDKDGDDDGRVAASAGSAAVQESTAGTDAAAAREITVTATDFAFSPAEITVKKGESIKLTLVNADGRHGIAIPAFGVNLRPAPGGSESTVFTADRTGSFPFFCNVFCGGGHGEMRGTLTVE